MASNLARESLHDLSSLKPEKLRKVDKGGITDSAVAGVCTCQVHGKTTTSQAMDLGGVGSGESQIISNPQQREEQQQDMGNSDHSAQQRMDNGNVGAKAAVVYPQREGEPDCDFFVKTGKCKYGKLCKFNHPLDLHKEQSSMDKSQDCPHFMRTGKCAFGVSCRFRHPERSPPESKPCPDFMKSGHCPYGISCRYSHPQHASEKEVCAHYQKTGTCAYGSACRYAHPPPEANIDDCQYWLKTGTCAYGPTCKFNHPVRKSITDCPHYMKTGVCTFGAKCKFTHPGRIGEMGDPTLLGAGPAMLAPSQLGQLNVMAPALGMGLGLGTPFIPNMGRGGRQACPYFMRTGECGFGDNCKFLHPRTRGVMGHEDMGRPCAFYMKTGTCKFGDSCKFKHPSVEELTQGQFGFDGTHMAMMGQAADGAGLGHIPDAYHHLQGGRKRKNWG